MTQKQMNNLDNVLSELVKKASNILTEEDLHDFKLCFARSYLNFVNDHLEKLSGSKKQ